MSVFGLATHYFGRLPSHRIQCTKAQKRHIVGKNTLRNCESLIGAVPVVRAGTMAAAYIDGSHAHQTDQARLPQIVG